MIRIYIYLFFLCVSFPVLSQPCTGNWSVKVDSNSLSSKENAIKLPIYIQVDKSIARCRPQGIYIRSDTVGNVSVKNNNTIIPGRVVDSSGNNSGVRMSRGVLFSLSNDSTTKLWVEFPQASLSRAGDYSGNLTVALAGIEGISPKNVTIAFKVSPFVDLGISSLDKSHHTMNFGVLKSNQTKSADVFFRANTPVSLLFRSEFGRLQHIDIPNESIAYSIYLDSKKVAIDDEIKFNRLSSVRATKKKFMIRVGDTRNAAAGSYKEVITIVAFAKP
ncbi:hypothetical protein VIN01S_15150 [Vibrio inusitatus NBRC 102082]|uniref:Uncharacterized protein n=2 Tax=Vibrio inusitatus TaxID=413402 RepID=A0A4Y3HUQ5_9VIBR|nr:hypothetical protein [Vibrio inusitatus]GEA50711.1 hypothetical protein VIN01S_15150 [Vibrio inusitatus NBRC 102082]